MNHSRSVGIAPLEPPYAPELEALLRRMTPPDAPETLALFRVLARHPSLAERMTPWAGFLLSRRALLTLRDREIVIDRVCVRCGAEYEWGVHVAAFAKAAGITEAETAAIAAQTRDYSIMPIRDQLLVRMVDDLHETARIDTELLVAMQEHWSDAQIIELTILVGWYHAISYLCNVSRVPLETWARQFPPKNNEILDGGK